MRELKLKRKLIDKVLRLRQQQAENQISGDGPANRNLAAPAGLSAQIGQPEVYKILFLEKVPKSVKQEKLEEIFSAYVGFIEVRVIQDKGLAFVEYLSDEYAAYALNDVKSANLLQFEDDETGLKVEAKINFGKRPKD